MPDGTTRFSMLDGTPIYHYMGCSTFANHTVMPEIALAKVRDDAPFDKICYIGCGVTTGIGAVINTAGVEIGSTAAVFGLGGIGLNVIQGLRMAGADMIIGVDLNDSKEEMARKFGMTHFINPSKIEGTVVQEIVNLTKRGNRSDRRRGLFLRRHRQREGDARCAGMFASRLGRVGHHRRGPRRGRDFHAALPAGHGPGLERHRLRRRQGPHRCAEIRGLVHGWQDRDRSA
jgi:threonine dehydrogenase-like Zn-dependent dehydrogenase